MQHNNGSASGTSGFSPVDPLNSHPDLNDQNEFPSSFSNRSRRRYTNQLVPEDIRESDDEEDIDYSSSGRGQQRSGYEDVKLSTGDVKNRSGGFSHADVLHDALNQHDMTTPTMQSSHKLFENVEVSVLHEMQEQLKKQQSVIDTLMKSRGVDEEDEWRTASVVQREDRGVSFRGVRESPDSERVVMNDFGNLENVTPILRPTVRVNMSTTVKEFKGFDEKRSVNVFLEEVTSALTIERYARDVWGKFLYQKLSEEPRAVLKYNEVPTEDFESMCETLLSYYGSERDEPRRREEILSLNRRSGEKAAAFATRLMRETTNFNERLSSARWEITNEEVINTFVKHGGKELFAHFGGLSEYPDSLLKAVKIATRKETELDRLMEKSVTTPQPTSNPSTEATESNAKEANVMRRRGGPKRNRRPPGSCFVCGKEGHMAGRCYQRQTNGGCFVCGDFGHGVAMCPWKKGGSNQNRPSNGPTPQLNQYHGHYQQQPQYNQRPQFTPQPPVQHMRNNPPPGMQQHSPDFRRTQYAQLPVNPPQENFVQEFTTPQSSNMMMTERQPPMPQQQVQAKTPIAQQPTNQDSQSSQQWDSQPTTFGQVFKTYQVQVGKGSSLPTVEVIIGGKPVRALIDTGSEVSILHPKFVELAHVTPTRCKVEGITSQELNVMGEWVTRIELGKHHLFHRVLVAEQPNEMVIGMDLLQMGGEVNLLERKLLFHNEELPFLDAVVTTMESRILKPQEVTQVLVQFDDGKSKVGQGMLSPIVLEGELQDCRLVEGVGDGGWALMVNSSNKEVVVEANTIIGEFIPIEDVDVITTHVPPEEDFNVQWGESTSEEFQRGLRQLLLKYKGVWDASCHEPEVPIPPFQLEVEGTPIANRPRRVPHSIEEKVRKAVGDMILAGSIEEGVSEWAFPIVPVKKPNGDIRVCVDFRQLNERTKRFHFPLPLPQDIFAKLGGYKFFSLVDLKSAFNQIPVDAESKKYLSFVTSFGQYICSKMPFGCSNGPAHFSLVINMCLRGIDGVFTFIDDILIAAHSELDMLEKLEKVFGRLKLYALKISMTKSSFCMKEVTYLGYDLSSKGILPAKKNVDPIKSWSSPSNKAELRTALGALGFYRSHVKNFSLTAAPLFLLTSEKADWNWGEVEETALRSLIDEVTKQVNSNHPSWAHTFCLRTDASETGGGGELFQEIEGIHRTIAFYSFRFSKSQSHYAAVQKECLAIVKTVQHFNYYLEGNHFKLETDNRALTWLKTARFTNHMLERWALILANFHFDVSHIPGNQNLVADALSRLHIVTRSGRESKPVREEGKSYGKDIESPKKKRGRKKRVKVLIPNPTPVPDTTTIEKTDDGGEEEEKSSSTLPLNVNEDGKIVVEDPMLVQKILHQYHDLGGHFAFQKTKESIERRYYIPNLASLLKNHIQHCIVCSQAKGNDVRMKGAVWPYDQVVHFGEAVHIDLLKLPAPSPQGNKYLVVMIDRWTRWVEVYPIPKKDMETVARVFINVWICRWCPPKQLISDRGKEFLNKVLKKVNNILSIEHGTTVPFKPSTNGCVERMNRTLLQMLRTYALRNQEEWELHLPQILHCYNVSPHASLKGRSPYEVLVGQLPRTTLEVLINADDKHLGPLVAGRQLLDELEKVATNEHE